MINKIHIPYINKIKKSQLKEINFGDITRVEIAPYNAEPFGACADITIHGFTLGKEVDFGSGFNNNLNYSNINNATIKFTIFSEGFDTSGNPTTVKRFVYATSIVRRPWPQNNEDEELFNSTIRVALSEFIYDDDRKGGIGTSGRDPIVTISQGCIRNAGGTNELNNGVTKFICTNSSKLEYPNVIAKWDRVAGVFVGDRVKTDFNMACRAYHKFGISCIKFEAKGRTSEHIETSISTTRIPTQRTGSGLYAEAYHSSQIPLTNFTQGELIDIRYISYPKIGDERSIIDTNDNTNSYEECLLYNKGWVTCDKNNSIDNFAVIDSSGGNNSTGVVSSDLETAEANPFLNISAAINSNANVIYLLNGTHAAVGTTISRKATNQWIVVTHHPTLSDTSSAIVQIQSAVRVYRTERLQYKSVTLDLLNTSSWLDGENNENYLRFSNVYFDGNSIGSPNAPFGYRSRTTYLDNCYGKMGEREWGLTRFSTNLVTYDLDGCNFESPANKGGNFIECYNIIACKDDGGDLRVHGQDPLYTFLPKKEYLEIAFNQIMKYNLNSAPFFNYDGISNSNNKGIVFVGNIIEKIIGTSAALQIAADGSIINVNNVHVWHNTVAGQRFNNGYNDTGIQGYTRYNWSQKFNSFRDWNFKDDTFGTQNSNRIKCWPVGYGVGFLSNHHETSTFPSMFGGFNLTTGSPSFVNDQSLTVTGTGGGNYTPDTGSILKNRIPIGERVITIDLFGNTIPENGDIGAIQST